LDIGFRFRKANRTEEGFYFGLTQPRMEVEEGEEDSTSNVKMDAGQGTFITTLGLLRRRKRGY
jgi:hypothetical protein